VRCGGQGERKLPITDQQQRNRSAIDADNDRTMHANDLENRNHQRIAGTASGFRCKSSSSFVPFTRTRSLAKTSSHSRHVATGTPYLSRGMASSSTRHFGRVSPSEDEVESTRRRSGRDHVDDADLLCSFSFFANRTIPRIGDIASGRVRGCVRKGDFRRSDGGGRGEEDPDRREYVKSESEDDTELDSGEANSKSA